MMIVVRRLQLPSPAQTECEHGIYLKHFKDPPRALRSHLFVVLTLQGWPAIAKIVLPAASAAHATIAAVIDGLQACDGGPGGGLTALQLAVRSGYV